MNVNHTSGRVARDFHHRSAEDIELLFVVEVPLDCRHASIPGRHSDSPHPQLGGAHLEFGGAEVRRQGYYHEQMLRGIRCDKPGLTTRGDDVPCGKTVRTQS